MPVPKRKRSKARRDKRFANKGMKIKQFTKCAQCEKPLMPHSACQACGFYKGAKVLATKADRALKRTETRKEQEPARQAPQEPKE